MLKRDRKVDILRVIALIAIIFAHVHSPDLVYNIRNFDVPLMTLLMGMSFTLSRSDKKVAYFPHVLKRAKRLILPTWGFLTVFFIIFLGVALLRADPYYFSLGQIVKSYALVGGIGYVWIIQVFMAIALLNPFILQFSKKISKNAIYLLALFALYLVYLLLVRLSSALGGSIKLLYEQVVLNTISYSLIAAVGIRFKQFKRQELVMLTAFFLAIFAILAFKYDFAAISKAKYPPTTYYITYGLFVSFALYLLLEIKLVYKLLNHSFVNFISVNSNRIYLWHIIPVYIIELFGKQIPILNANFLFRFIFALAGGLLLTLTQERLILWRRHLQMKVFHKQHG